MWFENGAFSGWHSARPARAVAPGPDAETLRVAYLELLKLCLCDLGGVGTISVWKHTDGSVMSRELAGEHLQVRSLGLDWPLTGLTMVGLDRLDDLQACVESVVRDGVPGDLIEAGTWRGGASILMRATLDGLGEDARTVWVADSFAGFPVADGDHPDREELAGVDFLAVPVEQVEANFARLGYERGVRFVPGFFDDTLPGLRDRRWSLVRLDGDSYEATWTGLQSLYPGLSAGGHVIVDDYGALDECREAVDDFRALHGITEPLEQVDWTCARWRRTGEGPLEPADPPRGRAASDGRRLARAVARAAAPARIPSLHERALERERRELRRDKQELERRVAELGHRAAAAETEIGRLHGSPLRGARLWLKCRLRRLLRV